MKFSFLDSDWVRGIVFALFIIGIGACVFAAQQYIDASLKIQENASYKAKTSETPLELQSQAEAQMLMAADVEYRRLLGQRDNAMIAGGLGLVAFSIGWLGNDVIRSRRRVAAVQSDAG